MIAGTSASTGNAVTAKMEVQRAVNAVANLPAAVRGAVRALVFDVVDNHRLRVISRAGKNFPGKRQAQKMVAARTRRYAKVDTRLGQIAGILGESFARPLKGDERGDQRLRILETGGVVTSRRPMFVPLGATAREQRENRQRFQAGKSSGAIEVVRTRAGKALVIEVGYRGGGQASAVSSRTIGILTRRRVQRPLLQFYPIWDETIVRRKDDFVRALSMAMTTAGQERLIAQTARLVDAAQAYRDTMRIIKRLDPGASFTDAKAIADEAARAVRQGLTRQESAAAVLAGGGQPISTGSFVAMSQRRVRGIGRRGQSAADGVAAISGRVDVRAMSAKLRASVRDKRAFNRRGVAGTTQRRREAAGNFTGITSRRGGTRQSARLRRRVAA